MRTLRQGRGQDDAVPDQGAFEAGRSVDHPEGVQISGDDFPLRRLHQGIQALDKTDRK